MKNKTFVIENIIDERIITPKTVEEYNQTVINKPITQSFFAPKILQTEIGELKLVCISEEDGKIVPYYKRN